VSLRERPLSGRAALVSGASRRAGIGCSIARRLAELGASVFLQGWTPHDAAQTWGADPGGVEAVVADVRASGGKAEGRELDLEPPDAAAALVAAAQESVGHLDILVVNHARSGYGTLETLTADEIDGFLQVNVRAPLLLVKEFALQHDGRAGGRVVLLTSGQHLGPMPREVAYAVSKGALQQATKTLSAHLIPRGITVNTINPGPTATGWEIGEPTAMPLGRWGEPDDAARLVAWLCTDDARWITGQVIDSEGGYPRG
jgi:3-oxoacyl-[acyl-carrier protein] reductase